MEDEFANDRPEIYEAVTNHHWYLYEWSVSDEDYDHSGPMMLVYMAIDHMSDTIIIHKGEGYWYEKKTRFCK